ncbi:MAG: ABC transporter ATP-binding protein [Chitinophagaceae bacterium]
MTKIIIPFFYKYKWYFLSGIFFVVVSNLAGVYAPQLTGYLLDKAIYNTYIPINDVGSIVQYIIQWIQHLPNHLLIIVCSSIIVLLAIIKGLFMFLMRQTLIVMSRYVEFDQKNMLYKHCQTLDSEFFEKHTIGDIMSRISEDVSRVRMIIGPSVMYLVNIVSIFILSTYYMFLKNSELTIYVLSPIPIMAIIIYIINRKVHHQSATLQTALSQMNAQGQESYSGIRIIQSFNQESQREHYFSKFCNLYRLKAIKLSFTEAMYTPIVSFMSSLSILILITVGGYKVIHHTMTIGTMAEFAIYIQMLVSPITMIGFVADTIQRGIVSQKRIIEYLATQSNITSKPKALAIQLDGNITLKNLSYTYKNTHITALKNINLNIHPGEKIAIIGTVGSGKTTLAQLLMRFEDASKGEILFNNYPIKNLLLPNIRQQIGYVPQHSFLFADSILNNIRIANPKLSEKKVNELLSLVNLDEDIFHFSNGVKTIIGEKGVTLSGGQKQRLALARAFSINPTIFILDDCFSAIDNKTENNILKTVKHLFLDKTVILFTHRYKALSIMDRIIVLENGCIIEEGTQEELINKKGVYNSLYYLQEKK